MRLALAILLLLGAACTPHPGPRSAPSPAAAGAMPQSVMGFTLRDSTRFEQAGAGISYRYVSAEDVWSDVFLYPVPEDRLSHTPAERIRAEGQTFIEALPHSVDRGHFEVYEVVIDEPRTFATSWGRQPGHLVTFVYRSRGEVYVSFMHLVLRGETDYVKVRLTLPAAVWQHSDAPDFALRLFPAMARPE